MRSRTVREGAVGLLVLFGVGLVVTLSLWLSETYFGRRSYRIVVEFANADGLRLGSPVLFRGVSVGKVAEIRAESNSVAVSLDIEDPDLRIPRNSSAEVDRTGLIGEGSLAIRPNDNQLVPTTGPGPSERGCDTQVLICHGERIIGSPPINYGSLIRAIVKIADLITDPTFQGKVDRAVGNLNATTVEIQKLSRDAASLARALQKETGTFGDTARSITRTSNTINNIAMSSGGAIVRTAGSIEQTAANFNGLMADNRGNLTRTLSSIAQTSSSLRSALVEVAPAMRQLRNSNLLQNLDALTGNAAQTAANLRDITGAINNPQTLMMLQQTLDSARATLQNIDKITGDLDDLTGDARFRDSLRVIVNSLGRLLASTQDLQQQLPRQSPPPTGTNNVPTGDRNRSGSIERPARSDSDVDVRFEQ
jgi:phospholipid/cholesterol/gamma-HCH transport system substrate-binding protein